MKEIFEKTNKSKEDLKIKVQKIFTDLRNALNEREDNLLLDIDNKYNKLFLDEDFIKQCEKLPNKIKKSLEIGKNLEEKWNNIKANLLINDCLNIENNIKDINAINEKIKNCKTTNIDFYFLPQDNGCKELIGIINEFGFITNNHLFDSKILFDQNLVKNWLNNKNFKAELLYRKSRDCSTPNDFHSRCDHKGITISFIETTKGYKFGEYTEFEWDCCNHYKTDKSDFIFSFNKKEKYIPKNNKSTIACDQNSGPRFGGSYEDILIYNTLNKGESYDKNTIFESGRALTDGEQYWDIKELEVHKIVYD